MKNGLLLGLLFFITALGFSQSPAGGATPIPKIRITTPLVNNPLRGKVVVQDSVTKNLDMIEMEDLAAALGSGGISEVTGVSGEITVANGTTAPVIGVSSTYTTARNTYADGKIASTITDGVTDSAPSQDAVFEALALKANLAGGNTFTGTQLMPILGINCTTPLSGVALNVGNPNNISGISPSVAIQSMGNNVQGVTMENTSTGTVAEMRLSVKGNDSSYLFLSQPGSNNTSTTFFGVPKNTGSFLLTTNSLRNLHLGTVGTGSVNIGTNNITGMTMNTSQVVNFVNPPTVPTAVGSSDAVPLAQMNTAIGTATGLSVPLAGTTDPITGDLVFDSTIYGGGLFQDFSGIKSGIIFNQDESIRFGFDFDGITAFGPATFDIQADRILLSSSYTDFRGILGSALFDKQNDPNAYQQVGDNHAIGLGITATAGSPLPSNDLDLITHPTGIYSFTNAATGNPTSDNGSVTIERISTNIVQTAKVINAVNLPRVFVRQYRAGSSVWTAWRELSGTDDTGFESAFLASTQAVSANTDTVITLAGSTMNNNGSLNLIDEANNVITPISINDVIGIDIALPFITPVGTNNYVSLILRVKTTGTVYRAKTQVMVKGAGNQDYLTGSWIIPINSDAQTNGLELIVNSNVGMTIDSKFLSVVRTHKGIN